MTRNALATVPVDLTLAEVAEILRVSPRTVRTWCFESKIPAYQLPSKEWRIPVDALDRWRANRI